MTSDRHPGCTRDEPEGCDECFLLATGASTSPENIAWARNRRAEAIVERIFTDDATWSQAVRAVQGEVVKWTAGWTDRGMPEDIAEDIICAVVREAVDHL